MVDRTESLRIRASRPCCFQEPLLHETVALDHDPSGTTRLNIKRLVDCHLSDRPWPSVICWLHRPGVVADLKASAGSPTLWNV